MFKVGIGPSSSHTMGPMVAAARFLDMMRASPFEFAGVKASLHGSLAFTGVGHATDRATILGLAGFLPDTYDNDKADAVLTTMRETNTPLAPSLPFRSNTPSTGLRGVGVTPAIFCGALEYLLAAFGPEAECGAHGDSPQCWERFQIKPQKVSAWPQI